MQEGVPNDFTPQSRRADRDGFARGVLIGLLTLSLGAMLGAQAAHREDRARLEFLRRDLAECQDMLDESQAANEDLLDHAESY